MPELEKTLKEILKHSLEIANLMKTVRGNESRPSISIEIGGWHGNRGIDEDAAIILIRQNTMRQMQATTTTGQSTFNEINVRIFKEMGLTYDKWQYEDYYYQEMEDSQ